MGSDKRENTNLLYIDPFQCPTVTKICRYVYMRLLEIKAVRQQPIIMDGAKKGGFLDTPICE